MSIFFCPKLRLELIALMAHMAAFVPFHFISEITSKTSFACTFFRQLQWACLINLFVEVVQYALS
jgi:glycopeptide antibiotics resistance protein